jgi:hypothetical protein
LTAKGVNKICFAFNKLKVFKCAAEINSTFFKFLVANFKGVVFVETTNKIF